MHVHALYVLCTIPCLKKLSQSVGTFLLETVCSQNMKLLSLEKSLEQANLIHYVYISNFILRKFQQTLTEHTVPVVPQNTNMKGFPKHKQLVEGRFGYVLEFS